MQKRYPNSSFFLLVVLTALYLLCNASALASSTVDVSTGKVLVKDKSSRTFNSASESALKQILIKLTGQDDISEYQALEPIVKDANRFLRAYRFTEQKGKLYFVAEFDRKLIENELVSKGLPIWGSRRPDALLWLATEDNSGQRVLVDDGSMRPIAQTVREQADARGVPLALPLMDLDDTLNINSYDVWGLFPDQLVEAAKRYQVDFVLAARLYPNRTKPIIYKQPEKAEPEFQPSLLTSPEIKENEFGEIILPLPIEQATMEISWLKEGEGNAPVFTQEEFSTIAARAKKGRYSLDYLYLAASGGLGRVSHDTLIGDDPNALMAIFINRYANFLGQNYAILPTDAESAQTVELSVGNLSSLKAFVAVQAYLQNLSVTDKVLLVKQQGTVSTFQVSLLGTEQDLRAALSLDSQLQPLTDAFGQPLEGLNYFWSQ